MLSSEARDECSGVRLWRVDHLLQVSFPILLMFVSPQSPFAANLSKAGQAWSTTATGNQRYLVFKSEENIVQGERHPEDVTLGG